MPNALKESCPFELNTGVKPSAMQILTLYLFDSVATDYLVFTSSFTHFLPYCVRREFG